MNVVQIKADNYAHAVYSLSKKIPPHEIYGLTSQLRRAALSVPLNITEGYARRSTKSELQFLSIAYGSLKESQYLLNFAIAESYLKEDDAIKAKFLGDEVARLVWTKMQRFKAKTT